MQNIMYKNGARVFLCSMCICSYTNCKSVKMIVLSKQGDRLNKKKTYNSLYMFLHNFSTQAFV